MAEFLTARGTTAKIEDIINNAKHELFLLSPFIKIPDTLFQSLKVADRRKVKITLVYGKNKLSPGVKSQLEELENLSICFLKNLHAKCYFNEECMVITSMNLYDFSEVNNKEMGVLVSVRDDQDAFNEAVKEVNRIIASAITDDLRGQKGKRYSSSTNQKVNLLPSKAKQKGYCIRCGASICYNLEKPYCPDCFSEWRDWENPDYEESCCHTCGKRARTTMNKPQCRSCYNKSQR